MERQKQNYRIEFPIAYIYSAKLRPNRLGPNIQNQQKIKGPIQGIQQLPNRKKALATSPTLIEGETRIGTQENKL